MRETEVIEGHPVTKRFNMMREYTVDEGWKIGYETSMINVILQPFEE